MFLVKTLGNQQELLQPVNINCTRLIILLSEKENYLCMNYFL